MNTSHAPVISPGQQAPGPLHHLRNNHGHWWIHHTLHLPDFTARRIRQNLGTKDLHTALRFRDTILQNPLATDRTIAAQSCSISRRCPVPGKL
jgi:hypothetical protein